MDVRFLNVRRVPYALRLRLLLRSDLPLGYRRRDLRDLFALSVFVCRLDRGLIGRVLYLDCSETRLSWCLREKAWFKGTGVYKQMPARLLRLCVPHSERRLAACGGGPRDVVSGQRLLVCKLMVRYFPLSESRCGTKSIKERRIIALLVVRASSWCTRMKARHHCGHYRRSGYEKRRPEMQVLPVLTDQSEANDVDFQLWPHEVLTDTSLSPHALTQAICASLCLHPTESLTTRSLCMLPAHHIGYPVRHTRLRGLLRRPGTPHCLCCSKPRQTLCLLSPGSQD